MKATELDKMKQDVIRSLAKNDLHVGSAGQRAIYAPEYSYQL